MEFKYRGNTADPELWDVEGKKKGHVVIHTEKIGHEIGVFFDIGKDDGETQLNMQAAIEDFYTRHPQIGAKHQ